jgi:hypothetical protein
VGVIREADADVVGPGVASRSRVAAFPIEDERTSPRTANARMATKSATAA